MKINIFYFEEYSSSIQKIIIYIYKKNLFEKPKFKRGSLNKIKEGTGINLNINILF
jgi:hypothetical protein